jgi:hypothetical protein
MTVYLFGLSVLFKLGRKSYKILCRANQMVEEEEQHDNIHAERVQRTERVERIETLDQPKIANTIRRRK